jgi:hypothetical protein
MIRSYLNVVGLCLAAVFAMSVIAASAAQAEGGPLWIVGSGGKSLASGETRTITSVNVSTLFKLKGALVVECPEVTNKGVLLGGNPGTDYTEITFKGCHLEKFTVAECGAKGLKPVKATNAGEVIVDSLTILAYPDKEQEGTKSALDAFAPEGESGHENLFVEFELSGTNCPATFKNAKVRVEAIGTTIKIKGVERKCGVLAQVGKINSKKEFELTKSGEVATEGALDFPEPFVKEAELLETGKTFKLISCELEADKAKAEEVGLSKIETSPSEPFGWDI